ncbi:hypothetical protein MRX96_005769 [Rhipicephalus microplus]
MTSADDGKVVRVLPRGPARMAPSTRGAMASAEADVVYVCSGRIDGHCVDFIEQNVSYPRPVTAVIGITRQFWQ